MNAEERHYLTNLAETYSRKGYKVTNREDRVYWLARAETAMEILQHFNRMKRKR